MRQHRRLLTSIACQTSRIKSFRLTEPHSARAAELLYIWYLPLDGQYRIHVELADAPREVHQLEVSVDGDRVQLFTLGDKTTSDQVVAADSTGIAVPAGERAESVAESLDTVGAPIQINSVVNKRFERDRQAEIGGPQSQADST